MAGKKKLAKGRCGKVTYASEFEARQRGLWLNMMSPVKHPKALRAYACSACWRWHLSSNDGA